MSVADTLNKSSENIKQVIEPISESILSAALVLLLGLILARVLSKLVKLLLKELEIDKILRKTGIKFSLEKLVSTTTLYIVYALTIITALNQLGLTSTILNVLTIFVVATLILSTFLSLKDLLPKFFAGVFIKYKKIVRKGDKIKLKQIKGTIIEVNFIETVIETKNKELLYLPNTILINETIKVKKKS